MSDVTDPGLELWKRMDEIDGFRMEYLGGEIVMMASPNTIHNRIATLVQEQVPTDRCTSWHNQSIAIAGRTDRPVPDLVVAGVDLADDYFDAVPCDLLHLLVEVVSTTRRAIQRDYVEKSELYARGNAPAYLIIDPNDGTWLLQSDPDPAAGEYRTSHKGVFGEPVRLPSPAAQDIATDRFRVYPPEARG